MKKKAQPQGNAAHRQKRMRPTKAHDYREDFFTLAGKAVQLDSMLSTVCHALEVTQITAHGLDILWQTGLKRCNELQSELSKADAALQSYVSSFDALKTNLLQVLDSHALLTRSQVVERIKELIK
jgi:hypothetical protein